MSLSPATTLASLLGRLKGCGVYRCDGCESSWGIVFRAGKPWCDESAGSGRMGAICRPRNGVFHVSDQATAPPAKLDAAVLKIAGVVVLGAIMSILDITVVSVALPTFQ